MSRQDELLAQLNASGEANQPSVAGDVATSAGRAAVNTGIDLLGTPAWLLNLLSNHLPQGAVPFFPTLGRPAIAPREMTTADLVTGTQPTGTRGGVAVVDEARPVQIPVGPENIRGFVRNWVPGAAGLLDSRAQTTPGRYTEAATEWALPALLGGPGGWARRLLTGAAGGAAGQGASDALLSYVPESYRPYADPAIRLIAGLGTMGVANTRLLDRANPSQVVRDLAPPPGSPAWAAAQQRMDDATAMGTRMLPAEALGAEGAGLQALTSDVGASRAGGPIRDVIATRGPEQHAAADQVITLLGGPRRDDIANVVREVSEGARDVVQEARRFRSSQTRPFYQAAEREAIPPNSITATINQRLMSVDPGGPEARALRGYATRIGQAQNVAQLENIYKSIRSEIDELIRANPSSSTAAVLADIRDPLNAMITGMSPNIQTGRFRHALGSERVNELRQPEVLGNLQRALPETGTVEAALTRQMNVINGEAVRPPQITRVFDELAGSSRPEAARDLAAVLLRNTLDDAARRVPTNPDGTLTGARLWATLTETPEQARRTEAIIRGMANANGQNPDRAWQGFQRMLDVFGQTGRIPPVGSRTAPREALARSLGSNWGSTALDAFNLGQGSVVRSMSTGLAERAGRADYAALVDALSSPDGLQTLQRMAGQIPNSPRAQAMGQRLLEIAANAPRLLTGN